MPKRVSLKGRGADLFFGDAPAGADMHPDAVSAAPAAGVVESDATSALEQPTQDASEPEPVAPTKTPKSTSRRKPSAASTHTNGNGPTSSRALAPVDADAVEAIRQVLKIPGREVSYVRLTPEEKARLSDIVYTYKRQGQRTSETEINRIALNYLMLDYHEHGEQSVLARVLAALLA